MARIKVLGYPNKENGYSVLANKKEGKSMKKYRSDVREVSLERKENFDFTGMIVWVGSSEYWTRVYLCKVDNRLYIREGRNFEALDTFNIRKMDRL